MITPRNKLGVYLRELRFTKGNRITQVDLAKKLGISTRMYLLYEGGKCIPNTGLLKKIAEFYASSDEEKEEIENKLLELYKAEKEKKKEKREKQIESKDLEEEISNILITVTRIIMHDMKQKKIDTRILAELAGIHYERMNKILLCEQMPEIQELEKIAHALGKSPERYIAPFIPVKTEYFYYLAKDSKAKKILSMYYQIEDKDREKVFNALLALINAYLEQGQTF